MRKFIDGALVVLAFAIGVIIYFQFDLEQILWNGNQSAAISAEQMKQDRVTDYTGRKAGDGVISMTTGEEWDAVLNEIDYVTVVPERVEKTDVYALAKWADYYTSRRNGAAGRRRDAAVQISLDLSADYCPYYIIELADGTRLLAQMNRGLAAKIRRGQEIELPLGRKIGISQQAKALLAPVCKEQNVSTDYVLYTIDDQWAAEHANGIFFGKLIISGVIALILAVVFQLIAGKILDPKEKGPKEQEQE